MIKQSILLLNDIFAGFDWLDRYGLLASPIMRTYPTSDGKIIKETFPAATIASGIECDEKNLYYLVPDERWKSLAYWELISDYRIQSYDQIPNRDGIQVQFDARLVIWYNVAALLFNKAEGLTDKLFYTIFTHLDGLVFHNPKTFSTVRVNYDLKKVITEKSKIFGRYSYRDSHDWLFQPPNEYLAADFTITIITTRHCLPELHIGNSNICNTRKMLTWDMAFPGVTQDVYQRWIAPDAGGSDPVFSITDFNLDDLSGLSSDQIDAMFLVFAGGRRLNHLDDYVIANNPDALTIKKEYAPEGTPVELYVRK